MCTRSCLSFWRSCCAVSLALHRTLCWQRVGCGNLGFQGVALVAVFVDACNLCHTFLPPLTFLTHAQKLYEHIDWSKFAEEAEGESE
jgi:hypothetical protein